MKDKKNVWALLGVPTEAKEKAKELSRAQHKKIGQWLTEIILNQDSTPIPIANNNNYDSINLKLDYVLKQISDVSVQIHNLNMNNKKSLWSKFLSD